MSDRPIPEPGDIASLNAFSRRFAEHLFAAHPEWRSLAERDPYGDPLPGSLLVRVPSPVPSRALSMQTYADQITIGFEPGFWHEHVLCTRTSDEPRLFDAALRLIDDLLSERTVVATRYWFGRPFLTRAIAPDRMQRPWWGRTEVVSWTGTRDATLRR